MFLVGVHGYAATIAAGASLSNPVPFAPDSLVGISMPPVWTPAPLTFLVSPDGGTTWQALYDEGTQPVVIAAGAGQFIRLDPFAWAAINMMQVQSGLFTGPVAQAAQAVVTLFARPGIL